MSLLMVNDRLTLGDKFKGTVRYIGKIRPKDGLWIGLELDEAVGANDGSVSGVRYFRCKDKHGIFVRYEKIKRGLVCDGALPAGSDEESLRERICLYEAKMRKMEETIEMLRDAEKQEIVELRRENEEVKRIVLSLRGGVGAEEAREGGGLSSEIKELAKGSREQVSEMMEIVSEMEAILNRGRGEQRRPVQEDERRRVVFLVGRIIDGVLDGDMETVDALRSEFVKIMEKHGIRVE